MHSQVTHADPESSQTQTQPPPGSVVSASANHTDNVRLPSPSPTLVQQPVAWESREYSLPDLGKYPALRRRRGAGKKPRVSKDSQTRISPRSTQVANPSQASQSLVHEQGDKSNIPTSTLSLFSYDPTRRSDGYSDSIRATAGLNDEQTPKSATDLPRNLEIGHQVAGSTASAAEPVDVSGLVQGRPPQSTSITSPSVQPGQQAQRSLSANPVTAPSSQTLSAGIIWPDSKKTALANAAMIELTCLTVNAGKQITTAQIRTILDSNPSYIELCEKFEGMGFVFDRGHFARSLLAAVPDVNSSTRARSPTNAPVQNCMDDAPQISNDAALRAPAMQGRQDSTSNGMTEVTNTDAPRSPNMTAMGGLAAIALENTRLAPNGVYTAGAPVKPFIGTPGILPRSPGRPRKDGSPAQPRKATQLRQAHSDHPDSLAPNGSLHLVGQTSGPLREESIPSGVGIPFTNKPALRDTANGGTIDKNIGLLEGGETLQKATKYGHQFNVRWDDERRLTQSSEVPKTRGHAAPDMAVHASAKRDVALNLNGGPLRAVINSNLPPANVGTTEASTTRVATKEEMARKRSFNDIVDLTQYLSGEDDDPSRASKKRRKEDPFKTHTDFPMGLTPSVYSPSLAVSPYPGPGNGTPIADGPMSISRFNYMTPGPLSQKQALYMNLIKPLDKKMALRRSEYNAKTIARDVLIAAGRHPNMRPLNAHLDVLRKNLFVVGNGSDLSTFDWDLVDPKPVVEAIIGLDTSTMHNADDEEDGLTPAEYFTPVQTIHQPRRDLVFATGGEVETLGNGKQFIIILHILLSANYHCFRCRGSKLWKRCSAETPWSTTS